MSDDHATSPEVMRTSRPMRWDAHRRKWVVEEVVTREIGAFDDFEPAIALVHDQDNPPSESGESRAPE